MEGISGGVSPGAWPGPGTSIEPGPYKSAERDASGLDDPKKNRSRRCVTSGLLMIMPRAAMPGVASGPPGGRCCITRTPAGIPPTPGAHLGIATDRGLPSSSIRFRTLHAINASVA